MTKWRDRAPLLGAGAGALAAWIALRVASPDYKPLLSIVFFLVSAVVGTAVGWLVARFGASGERATALRDAIWQSAVAGALVLELFWLVYQELIKHVDWPSGKQRTTFPSIDVVSGTALQVGGVTIQRPAVFTVLLLVVSTALLWYFINRTKLGRGMQAVSQDPDTARLMGINVDRIIVVAFALGAVLAAVAGLAQGVQNNLVDYRMGFLAGLKAFTAAVLGGIGNIQGAVLGGLLLGVVESLATQYIPGQFGGSSWKDVWAFVILILVLVFRPQGLLGARVVDRA
ncbi:branched-chain amino acid ABC transporter permease [Kribbella sp. DT2]